MPRLARTVFSRVVHHITQQGNRRAQVFFTDDDRNAYLGRLEEYSSKHDIDLLAYCLITNHIYLIAVPAREDALHQALKSMHMRYAQRINRARGWTGTYGKVVSFSSALDEADLWAAVCCVERNPVRAKMMRRAEDYQWSSAKAHCHLQPDSLLNKKPCWRRQFERIGDWSAWLGEGEELHALNMLRRNVEKGLPCGSTRFTQTLGKAVECTLQCRPQRRPKKHDDDK